MTSARTHSRRTLLKSFGAAAAVAAASGCAPMGGTAVASYERPLSRQPFVAPRISEDRVIRGITGLRPFRPSGFVVRGERLGEKIVIHNYGHGGGGITLSWGSSALAVREVAGVEHRQAAVIGSGVMGLTTARLLQDAGWQVRIYTRDPARHTTSNVAAGEWGPFSTHDPDVAEPYFLAQLDLASRISYHAYSNLTGRDYGIRWLETYILYDEPPTDYFAGVSFADLYPYAGITGPGEHPFSSAYVFRFATMQIDPAVLLRRLTSDFLASGGKFVTRNFKDVPDVLSVPESLIFNCTGLGARELFGDEVLTAAKGQLVFLPPDPAVDYIAGHGEEFLHMNPRSDVILLGGYSKVGDFSRHVEPEETDRIVTGNQRFFDQFA